MSAPNEQTAALRRNRILPLHLPVSASLEELLDRRRPLLRPFLSKTASVEEALLAAWRARQGYCWFFERKELDRLIAKVPDKQIKDGVSIGEEWLKARPTLGTTGGRKRRVKTDPATRLTKTKNAVQVVWTDYDPEDPEWMYGLNRHGFLMLMATAARRTGRADLAARVFEIMDHWIACCPCDEIQEEQIVSKRSAWGRHWKSPWQMLNCGLRLKHWMWALHLLWDSPLLTPARFASYVCSMRQQALVLGRTSPNMDPKAAGNHLLMETEALLYWSLLPWLKEAPAARRTALHNLARCVRCQILPDGGHSERVPGYHLGAMEWFAAPLLCCKQNGLRLPGNAAKRVESMVRYAYYVLMPNRRAAHFGDCSEARADAALDFACRFTGVVPPWKPAAAAARPLFAALPPLRKSGGKWPLARRFPHAGYVSARGDWSEKADAVVMHAHGFGGGHSHSDWLSFLYARRGRTIITERGVNTYDPDHENMLFRLGRAHNILQIDERDAVVHSQNMWNKWVDAKAELLDFKARPDGRAEWTARLTFLDGTAWTRRLSFFPKDKLLVEDELRGPRKVADTELRFHLNTVNAKLVAENEYVTTDRGLPNIRLRIEPSRNNCETSLAPVGLSPSFTRREQGLLLCCRGRVKLPARWQTTIEGR